MIGDSAVVCDSVNKDNDDLLSRLGVDLLTVGDGPVVSGILAFAKHIDLSSNVRLQEDTNIENPGVSATSNALGMLFFKPKYAQS